MATIGVKTEEKVFSIKKWLGLNENPDGDTKLKYGEAAAMRNFRITRDGNLKIRPGRDMIQDLRNNLTVDATAAAVIALTDEGTGSTLKMQPNIAVGVNGMLTVSGTAVYVTPDNAGSYTGYYWKQSVHKVWKLVSCAATETGFAWTMIPVKTTTTAGAVPVKGLWSGNIGTDRYLLAACNGKLWRCGINGTMLRSSIGSINTDNRVYMFGYNGIVYILNGKKYYQYDGNTLKEVEGYVPVVLTATAPAGGGTELEQVNKLTGKRRVWFSPDGTATDFVLPEDDLKEITSVTDRASGSALSGWTPDTTNGKVSFSSPPAAGTNTIEVLYEVKATATDRATVEGMKFAELYNGAQDTRVFLYGDGTNKVLYSGLDYDGNARADYFPDMNVALIGESNTPVTALIRHYSRLMAYKTESAYAIAYGTITLESGSVIPGFTVTPVNRAIGNAAPGQVRLVQNFPRTLHGKDCYEWRNNASYASNLTADERQAKRISDRVQATLAGFALAGCACWDDDPNQEYYICDGDTALVNNYAADAWYIYSDFPMSCMATYDGKLYMGTSGGALEVIDDDTQSDNGDPIEAYWESGSMAFDADYRRKYSAQIWVGLKPSDDSEIVVTVQTDKKSVYTEKVVQRKMATFADADFSDWSFDTNRKPFMQRLKIKAKKFTFYKLIFKSDGINDATVVAVDMRVRFNGYVK